MVFGKPGGEAVELSDIQSGSGGFAIRGAAEGDFSGRSVSGAGDVNGDGLADIIVGAYLADAGGRFRAGESYVIFGKADGEAVELSDILSGAGGGFASRGAGVNDRSGASVSGAGDMNGDGLPDLLVDSGLGSARYPSFSRATYVIFGRPEWRGLGPRFRRGAVLGGEDLDISDAVQLLRYLFLRGAEPLCLDSADADDSGTLDITDAVAILRYLFLGTDAPPAPGPVDCGPDPTKDALGCAAAPTNCGAE